METLIYPNYTTDAAIDMPVFSGNRAERRAAMRDAGIIRIKHTNPKIGAEQPLTRRQRREQGIPGAQIATVRATRLGVDVLKDRIATVRVTIKDVRNCRTPAFAEAMHDSRTRVPMRGKVSFCMKDEPIFRAYKRLFRGITGAHSWNKLTGGLI